MKSKSTVVLGLVLLILLAGVAELTTFAQGSRRVRSYTRRNGTYVQSHHRTRADRTERNNWSTKGNINPDTGKKGTKTPRR